MKISGLKHNFFNLGPKLIDIYWKQACKRKKVVEIALVLSCLEKQLYETLKNAEPSSVDDVLEGFKTFLLLKGGHCMWANSQQDLMTAPQPTSSNKFRAYPFNCPYRQWSGTTSSCNQTQGGNPDSHSVLHCSQQPTSTISAYRSDSVQLQYFCPQWDFKVLTENLDCQHPAVCILTLSITATQAPCARHLKSCIVLQNTNASINWMDIQTLNAHITWSWGFTMACTYHVEVRWWWKYQCVFVPLNTQVAWNIKRNPNSWQVLNCRLGCAGSLELQTRLHFWFQ